MVHINDIVIGENYRVKVLKTNSDWKGIPYYIQSPARTLDSDDGYFGQGTIVEVLEGPIKSLKGSDFFWVASKKDSGYIKQNHFSDFEVA